MSKKKTWFISDTHYHHANIVRGTSKWKESRGLSGQKVRDFDTLEEHDQALVDRINELVGEDHELYHMGDWSFGGIDQIWLFRRQLRCKNIHLILGNHDHHIRANKWLKIPLDDKELMLKLLGYDPVSVYPGKSSGIFANDLFSSVSELKKITIEKQEIILCHYALRVWERSHHGSWNLHGHSHGTLPQMDVTGNNPIYVPERLPLALQMDVGVDTNDLRPYSFEEIKEIMDKRGTLIIDHHNKNTN